MLADQIRADGPPASSISGRHEDENADTEPELPKLEPEINVSGADSQKLQGETMPTQLQEEPNPEAEPMEIDKVPWKGWAELENDPVIFSTILNAWGVEDVQVHEVIPLDAVLDKDPLSILGLVFLSRWTQSGDTTTTAAQAPTSLWFANQISTFSCATLALVNIINNRHDVTLGEELQSFKTRTSAMTPKERGMELDGFQFVKDIHNSFSRELDRMNVDLRLKDEAQAAAKKSKNSRRKKFGNRKKKKKRYIDDEDENGFHFVAYVPAQGHVWKLDGMEPHPEDMGPVESEETWLFKIVGDLQEVMEGSEANEMEFSLLSLDHEPGSTKSNSNEAEAARMREDWSPFIAHMLRLHAEKGDLQDLLC